MANTQDFQASSSPVYVVAAMVGKSFTTDDSAAASASASAKASVVSFRIAEWHPGRRGSYAV